eukprot:CAMPEP_0170734070 /NCGR_PEP_ID=MMETSP0437-20130122/2402_1 /TAXON_ID=0 /ORGANISM="Sexangularia sp." /LENGTH=88 /DNA_ID=CAMNT_0011072375 /DNA_START=85 /DNA_END=348 /DNA_ORIENTATION=-
MYRTKYTRCGNPQGMSRGRVCANCDGKCPSCESLVNSLLPARICDECKHSASDDQCILCGSKLRANPDSEPPEAYYCDQCVTMQYDRI